MTTFYTSPICLLQRKYVQNLNDHIPCLSFLTLKHCCRQDVFKSNATHLYKYRSICFEIYTSIIHLSAKELLSMSWLLFISCRWRLWDPGGLKCSASCSSHRNHESGTCCFLNAHSRTCEAVLVHLCLRFDLLD